MKTTLSSVYFGMGSKMANEINLSPEKSVDIDAGKVDSMKKDDAVLRLSLRSDYF
jgi:hypothetical protein